MSVFLACRLHIRRIDDDSLRTILAVEPIAHPWNHALPYHNTKTGSKTPHRPPPAVKTLVNGKSLRRCFVHASSSMADGAAARRRACTSSRCLGIRARVTLPASNSTAAHRTHVHDVGMPPSIRFVHRVRTHGATPPTMPLAAISARTGLPVRPSSTGLKQQALRTACVTSLFVPHGVQP